MKLASAAHVVFFVFFGFYLLFPPFSNFSAYKELFIKEEVYALLSEIINGPSQVSYFTFSISSFVSLIMLIMLIVSATLVGVCIINKYFKFFIIKNSDIKEEETYYCSYKRAHINKIYKLYCSWRN
ncbi:MAG: hypothetical protein WC424_06140 [Bacilli bacterium]